MQCCVSELVDVIITRLDFLQSELGVISFLDLCMVPCPPAVLRCSMRLSLDPSTGSWTSGFQELRELLLLVNDPVRGILSQQPSKASARQHPCLAHHCAWQRSANTCQKMVLHTKARTNISIFYDFRGKET